MTFNDYMPKGSVSNKHMLTLMDYSTEEIWEILKCAIELKKKQYAHEPHEYLRGKTLAMIFAKSSTRTRISFEQGFRQLGGHAHIPVHQRHPARPRRAHQGHRARARAHEHRRHHDQDVQAERSGRAGAVRPHPHHQRPDGRLPSLPGARGPADRVRGVRHVRGQEARVLRRGIQHGQLAHAGLRQSGHGRLRLRSRGASARSTHRGSGEKRRVRREPRSP